MRERRYVFGSLRKTKLMKKLTKCFDSSFLYILFYVLSAASVLLFIFDEKQGIVTGKMRTYTKPGERSMRDSIPSGMPMRALVRTPNTQKVITSRTFPCHKRRKKPMNLTPTSRAKRAVAALRAAKVTIADTAVPGATTAFF